jgi:hypothetical protein
MAPDTVPARSHLDELNEIGSLPGPVAEACFTAYRDARCHLIDITPLNEPLIGYPELPYNNLAIRAALVVAYAAGRASVLDGAAEVWRVARNDDDTLTIHHSESEAVSRADFLRREGIQDVRVEHRLEPKPTPWRAVDGEPAQPAPDGGHRYLSTACLHGRHSECGGTQHARGDPSAPHCKFCPALCECPCGHSTARPK